MAIEGRMIGFRAGRSKCWSRPCFLAFALALIAVAEVYGQTPPAGGQVSTPQCTVERLSDRGVRAHTNTQIFIPSRGPDGRPAPPGRADTGAPQGPGLEPAKGAARPQ
jgi:hypothetical protein